MASNYEAKKIFWYKVKYLLDIFVQEEAIVHWFENGTEIEVPPQEILDRAVQICTNSKKCTKASLFLALKGQKFDAHDFILEAINLGTQVFVIDNFAKVAAIIDQVKTPLCFIEVTNTTHAYLHLAKEHRLNDFKKVIGITGSVGKTSTREMIAQALLPQENIEVVKNQANLNNEIGVASTILQEIDKPLTDDKYKYAVIEMGMDKPGDLSLLSPYVVPNIMVITNISGSHLGNFNDFSHLANEKLKSLNGLGEDGLFIFSGSDNYLRNNIADIRQTYPQIKRVEAVFAYNKTGLPHLIEEEGEEDYKEIFNHLQELVKEGLIDKLYLAERSTPLAALNEQAQLSEMTFEPSQNKLSTKVISDKYILARVGIHHLEMLLFALAVCSYFNFSLEKALKSIKNLPIIGNRQKFLEIDLNTSTVNTNFMRDSSANKVAIFNDSYNANLKSYKSALVAFSRYAQDYKHKVGVCGCITGLGITAEEVHMDLGELLPNYEWDALFLLGNYAVDIMNAVFYVVEEKSYPYDDTYISPLQSQKMSFFTKNGKKVKLYLYETALPTNILKDPLISKEKLEKLKKNRLQEAIAALKSDLQAYHQQIGGAGSVAYLFKASHRYEFEKIAEDFSEFIENNK